MNKIQYRKALSKLSLLIAAGSFVIARLTRGTLNDLEALVLLGLFVGGLMLWALIN